MHTWMVPEDGSGGGMAPEGEWRTGRWRRCPRRVERAFWKSTEADLYEVRRYLRRMGVGQSAAGWLAGRLGQRGRGPVRGEAKRRLGSRAGEVREILGTVATEDVTG